MTAAGKLRVVELREHVGIDVVVGERACVLTEPEGVEPLTDVHRLCLGRSVFTSDESDGARCVIP